MRVVLMTLQMMATEAAFSEESFDELIFQIEHGFTRQELEARTSRWAKMQRSISERRIADASTPSHLRKPLLRPLEALARAAGRDILVSERTVLAPGF
jgi:hypothetical protein